MIYCVIILNRESFFHLVAKNTCGQHYNDSSYFFVGVTTKNVQMFCFVWFNFINDGATIIFSWLSSLQQSYTLSSLVLFWKTTRHLNLLEALKNYQLLNHFAFLDRSNPMQSELLSKLDKFVPSAKSQFQSTSTCIQLWSKDINVSLGRRPQFRRRKFVEHCPHTKVWFFSFSPRIQATNQSK